MILQVKEADLSRGSPQLRGNVIFTSLEVLQRYLNDWATHAVCHACLPLTDAYQTIFRDVDRRGRNDAVTTKEWENRVDRKGPNVTEALDVARSGESTARKIKKGPLCRKAVGTCDDIIHM